jgi:hypothetical protein
MSKGLISASRADGSINERVKCPKCGAKYDMMGEAASKAIDRLCAACWSDRHERKFRGEREARKNR